ncbi:uncharacterized protein LOC122863555 [Siniperca chuatsi]|uniref:uncharacterized protein LOC122863555 n=1 Tax=Siniperca chuatsi TaxID=119488 RepID=UPI001CE088D5|nr:uncharacterized protein LOC122863555 [Siniperca chuatsi]
MRGENIWDLTEVRMALPKAVGYMVVLVVICYSLENQGYTQSPNVFFEELMGTNASHIHAREKRATTLNSSDYVLQADISISDLERLRTLLNTFSPLLINGTVEITSIIATTVCSSNMTGYQCRCEQSFAWSYNSCIDHGACDAIIGDTCGCINALPADGQFCQLNTSGPAPPPLLPSPAPPNDPVDFDIVLDLRIPVISVPSDFINRFRETLRRIQLPYTITQSLQVIGLNFTTACYPNSTGGLQCHCEEKFAWSCDKCNSFGACSNATGQTCGCINGLPSDGEFCEPITNIIQCLNTTTAPPSPTPPNDPVDFDIVLDLRIPVISVPSDFINRFRETLRRIQLPYTITQSLQVIGLNFTTACYPNSTGGLQCHCEEKFAWSCDKCNSFGACSNATSQTCGCINGLPSDGEFCEPITNITQCLNTTTAPPSPTPPNDPVDFDIVLDLRIPVISVPSDFINRFRETLRRIQLPYTITQSLQVIGLNFTTACYPNSTGGLQCHCEEKFAWSCDKCNSFGACSNATSQTCGCINGLPSDGEFCEPITNITQCLNTTTAPPSPRHQTLKPKDPVDFDIVLDLRIPVISVPSDFINRFRETLRRIQLPYTITQSLQVIGLNFTTDPVDFDIVLDLRIPVISVPSDFINRFRETLRRIQLPYTITQSLQVIGLNFTTDPVDFDIVLDLRIPVISVPSDFINRFRETLRRIQLPYTITQRSNTTNSSNNNNNNNNNNNHQPRTEVRNLSFAMDIDFNPSFNDQTSSVYKNTNDAIQKQCKQHITNLQKAEIIKLRSGSTIVDYTVTATFIQDTEIKAVETGISAQLSAIYPILFDSSTALQFEPTEVFLGKSVTVTCGPPPNDVNFNTNYAVEWKLNDKSIKEDNEHRFSEKNGRATLTVSPYYITDDGFYECKLKNTSSTSTSVFRQKSNGEFLHKKTPLIQVTPTRKIICQDGQEVQVQLQCSDNTGNEVAFVPDGTNQINFPTTCEKPKMDFICRVKNYPEFSKTITLEFSRKAPDCVDDPVFGNGSVGDKASAPCRSNYVGEKTAVCGENKKWEDEQDNCILQQVQELLKQSENLNINFLPEFLEELASVTVNFSTEVVGSPANINAIVKILNNVANRSSNITIPKNSMENILITAGILTTNRTSWDILNANDTRNISVTGSSVSSTLLLSLENFTSRLTNGSFDIDTPSILLNKTTFTDTFNAVFKSSVEINIPKSDGENNTITVMTFDSMDNVLPPRTESSNIHVINGRVVLVQSGGTIDNVSFTFDIINNTLENPLCVFWNFSLFNGLGGWDDNGCKLVYNVNETVTCSCNHLTSFSILMSPNSPDDIALDYITYVGVGISMASLVICLIIEAIIWKKIRRNNTSYLRHVSIVNIAVSLLIADIWFIIGAAISDPDETNAPACSAATFFIHFFYLALFFWMLASALLLFYRTVNVFDGGLSKKSMLAIGFSLGYGAPLIIAIITIAVTAPKQAYIRESGICWLNWNESKALLAFVIPALLIVVINLVILLVVIYKMLRRRAVTDTAQTAERHVLVVIARSLAVLTPFFGLTWSLGVGTLTNPDNRGIHISFAFFNSLQGFFILVFGTLLDKKVRSEIAIMSKSSGTGTRSTSVGISLPSGLGFFRNWRRGRDGYNMSSSGSGASSSILT